MKKIDLHTHTSYSDGTFTPKELIEYAKIKNLSAISITDHDTINGLQEGEEAAKELGIEFINGIEFSISMNSKEFHILGLMFDRHLEIFEKFLSGMQKEREERNIGIIKLLKESDVHLEYEELLSMSKNGIITRSHFGKIMVRKGYVRNVDEAFCKYLSNKGKAYIPRNSFKPTQVIETIHEAGGIAILAHPYRYGLDSKGIEDLIIDLKNLNIDGIEAVYSSHTPRMETFLKDLASKYSLKISGGSDFHGSNKSNIDLGSGFGNLQIPMQILTDLKKAF